MGVTRSSLPLAVHRHSPRAALSAPPPLARLSLDEPAYEDERCHLLPRVRAVRSNNGGGVRQSRQRGELCLVTIMQKCFIGLCAKVSQWRQGRSNLYMCVASFQGYIYLCRYAFSRFVHVLLSLLPKYEVRLYSMPCCLASN